MRAKCSRPKCEYDAYTEFSQDEKCCIFHTEYGKQYSSSVPTKHMDKVFDDFRKYLDEDEILTARGFIFPIGKIISSSITSMKDCIVYGKLILSNPDIYWISDCKFHEDLLISSMIFRNKICFHTNICLKKVDMSSYTFKGLSIYGNCFDECLTFTNATFNENCVVEENYITLLVFLWAHINNDMRINNCSLSSITLHRTILSGRLDIGCLNKYPFTAITPDLIKHKQSDTLVNTIPSINLGDVDISDQGHITLDELNVSKTSFWKTNLLKDKPCIDFKLVDWGKDYRIYDDTKDNDSREIERLYREIKTYYESRSDHGTAGEFYVHEMRTRRRNTKSKIKRFLNRGYELFSRYGESISRPLAWLVGFVLLITSLLIFNGVEISKKLIDYRFLSFDFRNTGAFIEDFIYVASSLVSSLFYKEFNHFKPINEFGVNASKMIVVGWGIGIYLLYEAFRRLFPRR